MEETPNYDVQKQYKVAVSFSLPMDYVGRISDLTLRTGRTRNELEIEALDDLFAKYEAQAT